MTDPRVLKLASLIIHYSLEIKPDQQIAIFGYHAGSELMLAIYAEALRAGAFPTLLSIYLEADEILYKLGSESQLDYISPIEKLPDAEFDAEAIIVGRTNTHLLSRSDPEKIARRVRAYQPVNKVWLDRAARSELHWCQALFPTDGYAQDAGMSLTEFTDLLYAADKLDEPDPAAAWQALGKTMREMNNRLNGHDRIVLKGSDIDLSLSIRNRQFQVADGKLNLPDGELFTGPVEDSANGWVRFRYPTVALGHEYEDIELWFENGKVVKESAARGQASLTARLNIDSGSRFLGEWGIGMNYSLSEPTKSILFDEKLGGTIHLALGASYPETGGCNESGLHWDMICDMHDGEIYVDGDLFYQNGKPVISEFVP